LDITPSLVTMPYLYAGYSWPHPPAPVVPYRINENTADCGGEGAAVQTAASTWNVPANFSFSYTGATAATGYSYDGVNEVLWKDFGGGGTIAHAIIWYSGSTILENDIEFNDYYSWSAAASCPGGQFDVETIALHELGHWLCLSDLYDPADSAKVMYGYGSTGTTKRALTADDIAGIRYIYGTSSVIPPTVTNSTGASNITSTSARLNGELTSNGNADTTVHIYWGDNDAGTTPTGQPGGWDNDVNLGIKPIGTLYTDISGLTNGTAYYYRCFATNSAGSAWASSTASFTTLSGSATRYEYYDGSEGISSVYSSFWSAQTFIPSTAHKITSVKVKFFKVGLPPGTLTVGIRNTDASGHPTGSDLCSGTIPGSNFTTSNTGSWEEISLGSGYDLSASTKYAIVCRLTGGNGSNMVCCVGNWTNPQYSGGNYEHSGSGGSSWTYYNYDMAFEDWGTPSAPPTPPSPPALLSPGAAITFKWGTSTGATTYWLQVNTASDFTGINLFNAEVGNVTSQEVTGLSLGTTYYWRVKAGNSGGWSAWSSVRSVLANTMP